MAGSGVPSGFYNVSASASTTLAATPSVLASGSVSNSSGLTCAFESTADCAGASANLRYYVQLNGPSGGMATLDMVPFTLLQVGATGGTGDSDSATATVSLEAQLVGSSPAVAFYYTASNIALFGASPGAQSGYSSDFQAKTPITLGVGQQLEITLQSGISINTDGIDSMASASALADPYFYVDPTTPDATAYSVSLSPGVGNTPVPLPGSLYALLSGALALVAFAHPWRKAATGV